MFHGTHSAWANVIFGWRRYDVPCGPHKLHILPAAWEADFPEQWLQLAIKKLTDDLPRSRGGWFFQELHALVEHGSQRKGRMCSLQQAFFFGPFQFFLNKKPGLLWFLPVAKASFWRHKNGGTWQVRCQGKMQTCRHLKEWMTSKNLGKKRWRCQWTKKFQENTVSLYKKNLVFFWAAYTPVKTNQAPEKQWLADVNFRGGVIFHIVLQFVMDLRPWIPGTPLVEKSEWLKQDFWHLRQDNGKYSQSISLIRGTIAVIKHIIKYIRNHYT